MDQKPDIDMQDSENDKDANTLQNRLMITNLYILKKKTSKMMRYELTVKVIKIKI